MSAIQTERLLRAARHCPGFHRERRNSNWRAPTRPNPVEVWYPSIGSRLPKAPRPQPREQPLSRKLTIAKGAAYAQTGALPSTLGIDRRSIHKVRRRFKPSTCRVPKVQFTTVWAAYRMGSCQRSCRTPIGIDMETGENLVARGRARDHNPPHIYPRFITAHLKYLSTPALCDQLVFSQVQHG